MWGYIDYIVNVLYNNNYYIISNVGNKGLFYINIFKEKGWISNEKINFVEC
jgi:hypothetical protein